MVSRKGYQFRIYPNKKQEIFFTKTFGCVRFLYNHMLDDKIKYYEKTKKMKQTTPASYKKDHPFLKEVDSLALANAQLHLEALQRNRYRFSQMEIKASGETKLHDKYGQRKYPII